MKKLNNWTIKKVSSTSITASDGDYIDNVLISKLADGTHDILYDDPYAIPARVKDWIESNALTMPITEE